MKMEMRFFVNLIGCILIAIFINSCASTVPKPEFSKPMAPESKITSIDEVKVQVEAGKKVSITESEKLRVAEKIKQKIDLRKIKNSSNSTAKTYEIVLVITKYEKGNAFARAMLAGLGQIHINGDVEVFKIPGRVLLSNFSIKKTFAWGGIYGGSTHMEDIEAIFADGVAATLTGQSEEKKE